MPAPSNRNYDFLVRIMLPTFLLPPPFAYALQVYSSEKRAFVG